MDPESNNVLTLNTLSLGVINGMTIVGVMDTSASFWPIKYVITLPKLEVSDAAPK